jgi:hypothetical protein
LKFYSRVTNKPNSVVEEVRHGDKVIDRKRIAVFKDGVLETDDPEVIEKLKEHPDKFRTDGPWPVPKTWKDTEEGKKLLKRGVELEIDKEIGNNYQNIRKEYLESLIDEKESKGNTSKMKPDKAEDKPEPEELSYQEIVARAKKLGITTYKRKKDEILNDLKEKEVMTK